MLKDSIAEAQTLVSAAHRNQATIGGDPRAPEIYLQRGIEREPKGLILFAHPWCDPSRGLVGVETLIDKGVGEPQGIISERSKRKCKNRSDNYSIIGSSLVSTKVLPLSIFQAFSSTN